MFDETWIRLWNWLFAWRWKHVSFFHSIIWWIMPEVYTLRAPENFNYNNGQRLASGDSRGNENYDDGRIPSSPSRANHFLQLPSSSPVQRNSNPRAPTAAVTKKPKMSFLQRILHREKPKPSQIHSQARTTPSPRSNGLLTPSRNRVTTYTLTSPEDNLLPSHVSYTPPSPVSLIFEKARI